MSEFKEVPVYGVVTIGPDKYFLLRPRPEFMDEWLRLDERCFLACPFSKLPEIHVVPSEVFVARYIIVRGDYLIDFALAGRTVKIQKQEVTPLDKLDEEIEKSQHEHADVRLTKE